MLRNTTLMTCKLSAVWALDSRVRSVTACHRVAITLAPGEAVTEPSGSARHSGSSTTMFVGHAGLHRALHIGIAAQPVGVSHPYMQIAFAAEGLPKIERSRSMRFLFTRNGVGALRLAPAKGEILAGGLVERDHQVVRRHAGRRGNAGVDVFQECQPRSPSTALR
jgi:hypothetical protein